MQWFKNSNNRKKINNNIDDEEEEESDSEGICECEEGQKYNIIFTTTRGRRNILLISGEHHILKKYLASLGKLGLYFEKTNKICFLYNAQQLKFGDKKKLKDLFGNGIHFNVVVNDLNDIYGA